MRVLVTGVSSSLGRLVASALVDAGHTVLGIDRRPWPDAPKGVEMFRVDIRKRAAEDVFRIHRPEAMVHLATITHAQARSAERYRINLGGTRTVFEHCNTYGVQQAVFVGRHTVYGAAADTALYRTEADPPLAVATFPSMADLVAADLFAGSALWRFPKLRTAVLRMVYSLGPSRRGTLASFLNGDRVPMVLGFDPLFHLMHEKDSAKAIVAAITHELNGVFNVAGPPPVPLSLLCRVVGKPAVPVPEMMFPYVLGRLGFPKLPRAALAHVKYPVVVDDRAFRAATGFEPEFDEAQTMDSFRWAE